MSHFPLSNEPSIILGLSLSHCRPSRASPREHRLVIINEGTNEGDVVEEVQQHYGLETVHEGRMDYHEIDESNNYRRLDDHSNLRLRFRDCRLVSWKEVDVNNEMEVAGVLNESAKLEALNANSLTSDCVVQVLDFGRLFPSSLVLVTSASPVSLTDYILLWKNRATDDPNNVVVPERIIGQIAFQLINILKKLHFQSHPMSHGDINPDNILITAHGRLCLQNFSCAVAAHCTAALPQGDPMYWSPSKATNPRRHVFDPTNDIWGFGAVLYECAAGLIRNMTAAEKMNGLNGYSRECVEFILSCLEDTPDAEELSLRPFVSHSSASEPLDMNFSGVDENLMINGMAAVIESLSEQGLSPENLTAEQIQGIARLFPESLSDEDIYGMIVELLEWKKWNV